MAHQHKNNYAGTVAGVEKQRAIFISLGVGIFTGVVVSLFRLALGYGENFSLWVMKQARSTPAYIPILFLGLAAIATSVGFLLRKYPMITGSGIPQVKGIIMGHFKMKWVSTLLAKFAGGFLAVAGGLSVGREGPSIQLGAAVGQGLGSRFGSTRLEKRIYIAAGASGGLAAAFNAPLAGVIFCLEEIFKYFSPLILVSTMLSAIAADFVSHLVFGSETIFQFSIEGTIPLTGYWLLLLLGIVLGLFGALYNWMILKGQKVYALLEKKIKGFKMAIPFLFALLFGLTFPYVLGGGHVVMEELQVEAGLGFLLVLFALKLFFSVVSFSSGTPGGIFFPLLTIGAVLGAAFAKLFMNAPGMEERLFYHFIILAMAGYFTAIVRAPITGIVLLIEMTGSFSQLLPLTVVSMMAYLTAEAVKSTPIYDALLENMLAKGGQPLYAKEDIRKVTLESMVQFGAPADGKMVKELPIPEKCLLIAVRRNNLEFIPNGKTRLAGGDLLIFMTDLAREGDVREGIGKLTTTGE